MIEATYRELCSELGLVRNAATPRLCELEELEIIRVDSESGSVWAPLDPARSWGCRTCIASSAVLLELHYSDFERVNLTDVQASELIQRSFAEHGIPIAVTDIYGPQCWSVCFPVPDCPECGHTPRDLSQVAPLFRAPQASIEHELVDTGGARAVSSTGFLKGNRAAIGFASIVTNPYDGGDEPHATLLEGLVRTSVHPQRCEVAGGKGRGAEQALASFVGEALERYFVTGVFPLPSILGPERGVDSAISPVQEFGFPALDDTPGIEAYSADLEIEWVPGEELTANESMCVPANLAYCSYEPRVAKAATFSVTSTTGVAAGATVEDATLQALFELVERDAFWFYARTGATLPALPMAVLPEDVSRAVSQYPGEFLFHELPNPSGVPVVHATYVAEDDFGSRTARGIGAGTDRGQASLRAFVECLQIRHSLNTGAEVDPVDDDMRHIWYTGESVTLLPNFFDSGTFVTSGKPCQAEGLSGLISALARQDLRVFRVVLAEAPSFAVVRLLVTSMCLTDATYFSASNRFSEFSRATTGTAAPAVRYSGPTFM